MPFSNIDQVKYAQAQAGYTFFSKRAEAFHKSALKTGSFLVANQTFITVDTSPVDETKAYKLWEVRETGSIHRVEIYASMRLARQAQKLYVRS